MVIIVMGSTSDMPHAKKISDSLREWDIPHVLRVSSAHKATRYTMELLASYESDPTPKVYITIAGRSNALSAVVDANVTSPVIACPPYSDKFGGTDIFSSLRMPSGVAPAVIIDPEGAALYALKILAMNDPSLKETVLRIKADHLAKIVNGDNEIVAANLALSSKKRD